MDELTKATSKKVAAIQDETEETSGLEPETVTSGRSLMEDLAKTSATPLEKEALVEGRVIDKGKMALYVDLAPFGTGIIFGREYLAARDLIKKVSIGDTVTAKVVEPEGERGYIELSLKEAKQALFWSDAERAMKNKDIFELSIKEANKGGLILEWQGIDGFIPASQLKPEHYPRVPDGDKDKIAEELRKLIGDKIAVAVIGVDPKEGKLIFSEKSLDSKSKKEIVSRYAVGDVVEGEVTGAVDFGIFLKIEDGLEGLVHISEIDWALVENPRDLFKVGDKVKAKVIEVKDDKISLSIKALKESPWTNASKKYKRGDIVKGVVIKYNKHGALVAVEEGVAGLVHISEFKSEDELREKLGLGKSYTFTINLFEPKDQRMTLLFGERKVEDKEEKKEEKKEEESK